MPVVRALTKVAKKALLAPGCGCQVSAVAVRHVSFSPRQVTNASDASFHSVSFCETDHPKILITGMTNTVYHCLTSCLTVDRCSVLYWISASLSGYMIAQLSHSLAGGLGQLGVGLAKLLR